MIERSEFTGRQTEPANKPLFQTADYVIELLEIAVEGVPHPALLRKYAIVHKTHRVVAGLAEQFGGAIEAARNLQESADQAISGEKPVPGDRPIPRAPRGFGGPGTPPQLS
jgi:hypothetical protein